MQRILLAVSAVALAMPALADEGMWLFNLFPKEQVKARYEFDVSDEFLEHLRLSSVRLGGGSSAFVSSRGLIFTNHHVAASCIQSLSSAAHDYMKDGFWAATPEGELKCPDMEANVLVSMEDVTAAVNAGIKPDAEPAEANAQRKTASARLEKECAEKTGGRCDVVTLFHGQRYDLYGYRKYTDLRLVFAPEFVMAFFGGDPDNFTYPRYDLDITFLRAYENGRPAEIRDYLKWSRAGAQDNELVFVSGSPGSTSRLNTAAQLSFEASAYYPFYLSRLATRIAALQQFSETGEENKRLAQRLLFGFSNSYKGSLGKGSGLQDARLMGRKRGYEAKLRGAVERDPKLGAEEAKVWEQVAAAYKAWAPNEKRYQLLDRGAAQGSSLFRVARHIVRLTAERDKPNGERLAEYRDSGRHSLELQIYSPAPITEALEGLMLTIYFEELQKTLGDKDGIVKTVLAGRAPQAAAEAYVKASRLKDISERKRLAASKDAVASSEDGMIRLALLLDSAAREIRKKHEDLIEAVEADSVARIAGFRFKLYGANDYPDATRTLRLAFGAVKGYKDKAENAVPWATTFGGLYHRATGEPPYQLPPRWVDARPQLNLVTPFNFVSTADITSGNSGSPTVNKAGEVVGIVFDGNLESLPNIYLYAEEQGRSVHVASQGIVEALRKLYKPARLLEELGVQ